MKVIAHIDLDAFFASVEERDHGWFRNKPLIVGADPQDGYGRGVVSTANYKARKYGVHSALPISQAWRLCKDAESRGGEPCVFAAPDFKNYSATSGRIMKIIRNYSHLVEEASIDEAYFDLTHLGLFEKAEEIARALKTEIVKREKLTASVGIGPNKLIAKIASDFKKPDGLTVVGHDDEKTCLELVERFLEPMPVRKIPGVGPKTEQELLGFGVKTIADLKKFSLAQMKTFFGKWGEGLYEKARGRGETELAEEREAKSIGAEETYDKDTLEPDSIFATLRGLTDEVYGRFRKEFFKNFKTIVIKVRFADFETKTSAHTLSLPSDSKDTLNFEAMKLLMPYLDRRKNQHKKPIRLIGIRIEKLGIT